MKKLFLLALAAAMSSLAGCSRNTPRGVVENYMSCIQKGEYDKSVQYYAPLEGEDAEQFRNAFSKKMKDSMDESGGLKSYEVLKDSVCNDSLAIVWTRHEFGNGEVQESKLELVKRDGEWKIDPMSK